MKTTPLYGNHVALGARMADFAGWQMPIHYGSQIEEHHRVRRNAGMFDVSHMTVLDLMGGRVREFLRYLLANDAAGLKTPGKALYSCMLNESGGVMDDLIVYFMTDDRFRMVVNAATRDKDLAHIKKQASPFAVQVRERADLAMIAVQGPNARDKAHRALGRPEFLDDARIDALKDLGPFFATEYGELFIARTGYTGEDGYEIMLPNELGSVLWQRLADAGAEPIGLGARDTLRLEAGMNLYGQDMTEETSPLESGLGWTVAFEPPDRDFIGREALMARRGQNTHKLTGLTLTERGMLRPHQKVTSGAGEGEITSGSFSPTLGRAIALARMPVGARVGDECAVEVRSRHLPAKVVKPVFVRHGKAL